MQSRFAACFRAPCAPLRGAGAPPRFARQNGSATKKGRLLTTVLYNQSLLILRGRKVIRCASRHILRLVLGITVLERVKRWVLAMLALLLTPPPKSQPATLNTKSEQQGCAWLRSRRFAALLTRPPLRDLRKVSGRRASRPPPLRGGFDLASGGSNKGLGEEKRRRNRRSRLSNGGANGKLIVPKRYFKTYTIA